MDINLVSLLPPNVPKLPLWQGDSEVNKTDIEGLPRNVSHAGPNFMALLTTKFQAYDHITIVIFN